LNYTLIALLIISLGSIQAAVLPSDPQVDSSDTKTVNNLLKDTQLSKESGWKIGVSDSVLKATGSVKLENGKAMIKHPKLETKKYDLQIRNDLMLDVGEKYKLAFEATTTSPAVVEVVYGTRLPPYTTYERTWIKLNPQQSHYELVVDAKKASDVPSELERPRTLRLYFGGNPEMDVTVSNISLEHIPPLNIGKTWDVFLDVTPPASYANLPLFLETRSGKQVTPRQVQLEGDFVDLAALGNGTSQEGDTAVLYNAFQCDEPGTMQIGMAADWWMAVYVNGDKVYSTVQGGNKVNSFLPSDHVFDIPVKKDKNLIAVRVLSGSGGWQFVCGVPAPKPAIEPIRETITFTEGPDWKPVDLSSLEVKANSALDLSSLIDAPAGKHGRLIVNADGSLAFETNSTQAVKLRGFNGIPRAVWQHYSEEEFEKRARRFAKAARRQGYRILRSNMIECALTSGVDADMTFNQKYLRRWDYLIAELKQQGIYMHFVVASYGLYYSPFSFEGDIFKKRNEHKLRMFMGEESERSHWKFGAEFLLNHVNPYTGLAWKDDPTIAVVEFYNEQENGPRKIPQIVEVDPVIRNIVETRWRAWLINRFGENPSLDLNLGLGEISLADAPIPEMRGDRPELANLFSLFIGDIARENAAWFENVIRKAGYPGLVTQYNFSKKLIYSAVRWEVAQVVESNGYFCHPHNGEVGQFSSIEKQADYWRGINSTRLAGRPFLVTEFNHTFWNRYQHEGGLVFGAYSALQDFGSIMIHSSPVELETGQHGIQSFTCGSSPIVRANEFLAGCLFQRGDVRKSVNAVELRFSNEFLYENKNSDRPVSSDQGKLALMTGFSLAFSELPKPLGVPAKIDEPSITIAPTGGGQIGGDEWATSVIDAKDGSFSLDDAVGKLKQSGILPAGNISNPSEGIFQSDTGEIIMRANEKLLKVVTARTEAVSLGADKGEKLDAFHVENTSEAATVAVCAMDDQPVASSSRLVLIYSTEVVNSGMELSYDRAKMIEPGVLPVLMKTGILTASLKNNLGADMSLYALNVDGSRTEKLPLTYVDGSLQISIDTHSLTNGTTPFFELITN
jgi:hypothetical protein